MASGASGTPRCCRELAQHRIQVSHAPLVIAPEPIAHCVELIGVRRPDTRFEKVVVERRRPVTDQATGETLTELTVEMVETSEVPLVAKGVRVREEVVVRRERTKRVETVRDTIRRDEVEISNAGGRSGNKRAALAYSRK